MRWIILIALAAAMAFAPARAYTPESGVWWNPEEPGSGLQIEVQDNFISVFGYAYDEDGFPLFVTAQGFLSDDATRFASNATPDGSWLTTFFGGQCIGCPYPGFPDADIGAEGPIVIQFDPFDPTRAELTWGGRTVDIERYQFYLKRPEDGSAPIEVTKMLGEWNATFDLTEFLDNDTGIQYFGEVMVIDDFDFVSGTGWFYYGCRPEHMVDGLCTTAARASTELAGFYDPAFDIQIIIVNDTFDQFGNPATCLYYDARTGTNMFEGGLDDDFDGENDGGVAIYPCPPGGTANPYDYDFFPVRGFRSASRTFVQDQVGPSRAKAESAAPAPKTRGLPVSAAKTTKVRDAATAAKIASRLEVVRKLEAQLRNR